MPTIPHPCEYLMFSEPLALLYNISKTSFCQIYSKEPSVTANRWRKEKYKEVSYMSEYRRLDFEKLNLAPAETTFEEALANVTPLNIPDDVISAKK